MEACFWKLTNLLSAVWLDTKFNWSFAKNISKLWESKKTCYWLIPCNWFLSLPWKKLCRKTLQFTEKQLWWRKLAGQLRLKACRTPFNSCFNMHHLRSIQISRVSTIICSDYSAVPRSTLGHYQRDIISHPMLITAFYQFPTQRSLGASSRGWVLKPDQALSGVWTCKFAAYFQNNFS